MKILIVHNFYGSVAPSGENQVFEAERDLLIRRGHEVKTYTRHSDEIRRWGALGTLQGALATPWNPFAAGKLRRLLELEQPDVMHVHNTFPLLSPAIFHAIESEVALVLTLHNYRLFCPAAIPIRRSKACTECIDIRSAWPSLRYGCYRVSRFATLPLAVSVGLHRILGTWKNKIDAFITLSDFQRKIMVAAGLPENKVHVKPNFYPGLPVAPPWKEREDYAVFAGRISEEKGVENLIRAWIKWGDCAPELRILGDGPLREKLAGLADAQLKVRIRFHGQIESDRAQNEIARARLLVLPSVCFEGFPMVVREAFAFGTPVAVSDIGPLPDIVKHGESGVVFKPGNPESLKDEVRKAWETPGMLERLGEGARAAFLKEYTEDVNYKRLMEIYEAAIRTRRRKRA